MGLGEAFFDGGSEEDSVFAVKGALECGVEELDRGDFWLALEVPLEDEGAFEAIGGEIMFGEDFCEL